MEICRRKGRIAVCYLNGAFSGYRFAVVDLKGLRRIGYYKTLPAAESKMCTTADAAKR